MPLRIVTVRSLLEYFGGVPSMQPDTEAGLYETTDKMMMTGEMLNDEW